MTSFILKKAWIALSFLCGIGSFAAAQNFQDSLHLELSEIFKASELPGFAVAAVTGDSLLYSAGFGFADLAEGKAFSTRTVLNIGSVSKTFIGMALMQLVEAGKIDLDADINAYLPHPIVHPRFPDKAITLRHLATHTSGISDSKVYGERAYVLHDPFPAELEAFPKANRKEFKALKDNSLCPMGEFLEDYLLPRGKLYRKSHFTAHAPGTEYEYTNVGATLAAWIIELVSGQSFSDYTREHILQPIGMAQSAWRFQDIDMADHATLYFTNGIPVPKYSLVTYPDGGLLSSCKDLSRYLQEVMRGQQGKGKLLSPEGYTELTSPQKMPGDVDFGVFWEISAQGHVRHNGGDPGIFTIVQFSPEDDRGWIFMTNVSAFEEPLMVESVRQIWQRLKARSMPTD